MKNFLIVVNSKNKNGLKYAKKLETILKENGCNCVGCILTEEKEDLKYMYTDPSLVPKNTEAVIVLGGDGTIIHAAKDLLDLKLPMFGINFGTLGYLAEIEMRDLPKALKKLKNDDYVIEDRMLLKGEILRNGKVIKKDISLNDIVLNRNPATGLLKYDVTIDGVFLNSYAADGLIISTPTGSTGYSLSAGGPVVHPIAEIILITPLCAHTLNSRTLVFSAKVEIGVTAKGPHREKQQTMVVSYDGDGDYVLEPGDVIRIKKSRLSAKIIKMRESSFVEHLGKKMRY